MEINTIINAINQNELQPRLYSGYIVSMFKGIKQSGYSEEEVKSFVDKVISKLPNAKNEERVKCFIKEFMGSEFCSKIDFHKVKDNWLRQKRENDLIVNSILSK